MAWVRLADETEIPEGEGRAFEAGQRTIAIFRSEGKYYAIDDQCPHGRLVGQRILGALHRRLSLACVEV